MILALRSVIVALVITIIVGCGQPEKPQAPKASNDATAPVHDPDDVLITEADVNMPANYREAIARIKAYRDTIRTNVEANAPTKAHRPLDELDIVLNKLPTIARDSGIARDHWETINTSAQELRTSFNQVHAAIDAKQQPDYQAVAQPIEAAIGRLEAVPNP